MQILTTAAQLQAALAAPRKEGQTIGFVPTMGALHAGHRALLDACRAACDVTVASIFVNPTQFDRPDDLESYPRTPLADEDLLKAAGCDHLYRPGEKDIYPRGRAESLAAHLDFGTLTARMEGRHRPGHFAGVAQVMSRLLQIVEPHSLFLGQKDYQQVSVVRRLIELLELDVRTVVVPTVREPDGLAMSSRNRRLSPDGRRAAGRINRHLAAVAAGLRAGWPSEELIEQALTVMRDQPLLEPEYLEVFNGDSLEPYTDGEPVRELVVATAVHVGPVRLIDNRIALSNG